MLALRLFGSAIVLTLMSCTYIGTTVPVPQLTIPPLSHSYQGSPPRYLIPHSQKYIMAVTKFEDRSTLAQSVSQPIADIFNTELYKTRRFDMYHIDKKNQTNGEHTPLNNEGESENTVNKKSYRNADGVLYGSVTSIESNRNSGTLMVDYRIVNPATNMVVFSDNFSAKFYTSLTNSKLEVQRSSITKVALDLAQRFVTPENYGADRQRAKQTGDIHVVKVIHDDSGAKLILNVGTGNNIMPGFTGFVIEDQVLKDGEHSRHMERYLAKFIVINTFQDSSIGLVIPHCNNIDGLCKKEELISSAEQISLVKDGARVRLK